MKNNALLKASDRRKKYTGFLGVIVKNDIVRNMNDSLSNYRIRGRCAVCKNQSMYYCFGCKVHLCLNAPNKKNIQDQFDDDINFVSIGEGKDQKLLLNVCFLKYHSQGIDRYMNEIHKK